MDLTWQCVEAAQAADVVEWRAPGELGAATVAANWLDSALARIPDGCIDACSPTDDCFHGNCVGTDGSSIVYDQTIVSLEEADGTYYTVETRVEVIPVEGTSWDLLTVNYTRATAFLTDGSSSRQDEWVVAWEELLVPEWPQDGSFVVHAGTDTTVGSTTTVESWLDRECAWSSTHTDYGDTSSWLIQMQTETVEVEDPAAYCAQAAWSIVDGTPEGLVDRDSWEALDADPCDTGGDPTDDGKGDAEASGGACGCGSSGAAWLLLPLLGVPVRRRR